MFNSTHIELSRDAFKANLDFLKTLVKPKVKLSFVVKGNAYGHGIHEMVQIAEEQGVNHFSVYTAEEAAQVFDSAKFNPTILIMGFLNEEAMIWAVENDIEFFVFEMSRLEAAVLASKQLKKKAKVHVELETGMHRTGFEKSEIPKLAKFLKANAANIETVGCCTHFAGSESISNFVRVKNQRKAFKAMLADLKKRKLSFKQIHSCCSAATIRFPEMHYDLVRIGIMHYGFWPSEEIFVEFSNKKNAFEADPLKRIITWKSKVMAIKDVKKGEFIGYGSSYLAHEDSKIALVPVGYGYGYSRSLSNTGRVLINDIRAGIVGLVNMNCIAVNITNFQDISIGDEVILIGGSGENSISVSSFSTFSDQLNYELLTRLPLNIPRIIK